MKVIVAVVYFAGGGFREILQVKFMGIQIEDNLL
jgi:hypothetical protein